MYKLVKASVFLSVLLLPTKLLAETFYYHNSSSIELGRPYDSFSPAENLSGSGMFEFSEDGYTQEPGVNEIYFNYSEINSSQKLSKVLSIDVNAEAKFAFASGQTSTQFSKFSEKSENEIIIAITAYREYKPRKVKGTLSLTTKAKDLLKQATDAKKIYLWRQIAGSDVVMETTSGHSITLFYHFTSASSNRLEELRTALSAEWSSGKASANIVSAANSSDSTVSVKIDYYQVGGNVSSSALNSILSTNNGDVTSIKNALKLALETGDSQNARILRFNTVNLANVSEVVFGTDGEYSKLSDYYTQVLLARQVHFDRSLMTQKRLNQAQRLLDEKPENSYTKTGKANLLDTKDKLQETYKDILKEYSAYQTLNPTKGIIKTTAGSNIPLLKPTTYFKAPFVKPASWVMSNGSASRCGWSTYKDCEFHDFSVAVYPVVDFILPEFIQRIRIIENCVPLSIVRKDNFASIKSAGGSLGAYYQATYSAHKVYTWGVNHMPSAFNNWKASKGVEESKKNYILEVVTTDETAHYVDLGAYGKAGGKVIDIQSSCKDQFNSTAGLKLNL
ncbi:hypothetical protein AB6D89_23335 [Vibrio splendidus]